MARIAASYLVIATLPKQWDADERCRMDHETIKLGTDEEWRKALVDLDKSCRPTRQNVLSNGYIPNPIPLHWCDDCECWVLSKKHDHDRSRVPQIGDVWEDDHTSRIIPCGADYDTKEHIDWETDPRVVTTVRAITMTVTKVEHVPEYDAWEYNGTMFKAMAPDTLVHYTRTLTGDWSSDDTMKDAMREISDNVILRYWREIIKGMVLQQCNNNEVQS